MKVTWHRTAAGGTSYAADCNGNRIAHIRKHDKKYIGYVYSDSSFAFESARYRDVRKKIETHL